MTVDPSRQLEPTLPTCASESHTTMQPRLSHVPVIDKLFSQGIMPGKVYAILGPIGSGRTTLATQIAAAGACREAPDDPGVWVYCSFKERTRNIWEYAMSSAASISRTTMAELRDPASLSDPENLFPYEIERNLEHEWPFLRSERQRFDLVEDRFRRSLVILDYSAMGYMGLAAPCQTFRNDIHASLNQRGVTQQRIAGVVIDSALQAATARVAAGQTDFERDPRRLSGTISSLLLDARKYMAEQWQCPVWLVHSVRGNGSGQSPNKRLTHAAAESCRNFGRHIDGCVVIGTSLQGSGLRLLECTKNPMGQLTGGPIVVKTDEFARLSEVSEYVFDARRGIVNINEPPIFMDDRTQLTLGELDPDDDGIPVKPFPRTKISLAVNQDSKKQAKVAKNKPLAQE